MTSEITIILVSSCTAVVLSAMQLIHQSLTASRAHDWADEQAKEARKRQEENTALTRQAVDLVKTVEVQTNSMTVEARRAAEAAASAAALASRVLVETTARLKYAEGLKAGEEKSKNT